MPVELLEDRQEDFAEVWPDERVSRLESIEMGKVTGAVLYMDNRREFLKN